MTPAPRPSAILTVGHSDREPAAFLDLLRAMGVAAVADVRRHPASRRHPWFDALPLSRALAEAGIAYRGFEALGGRRGAGAARHAALEPAWRGYAEHMAGPVFRRALADLLRWAAGLPGPVALLCAERDPGRCHRHLIADHLQEVEGVAVVHWLDRDQAVPHRPHPALRREGAVLVYDRFTSGRLPW